MVLLESIKKTTGNTLMIIAICIAVGFSIYFYVDNTLREIVEESLVEIAKQGALSVEYELHRHMTTLEMIAESDILRKPDLSIASKAILLNQIYSEHDFSRLTLADLKGNAFTSERVGLYIGDRDHFQTALRGYKTISAPLLSRVEQQMVVIFAVPVIEDKKVTHVLTAIYDVEALSKITDSIQLTKEGNSFIVDERGFVIAHGDRSLVVQHFNPIKEAERISSLNKLANLTKRMIQREVGAGSYQYKGIYKYMGFAPIKGTQWSLGVTAPRSIIFKDIDRLLIFLLGTMFIIFLFIGILNLYLGIIQKRLQNEQLFAKNVIDIANIIMIGFDEFGLIQDFNVYAEQNTGYLKTEIVGKKSVMEIIGESDRQKFLAIQQSLAKGEIPRNVEMALVGSDGQIINLIVNFNLSQPLNFKNKQYELIGFNISERVKAEKALQESHAQLAALNEEITISEEKLRSSFERLLENQKALAESEERNQLVMEATGIGIWDWDAQAQKGYYSPRWFEIFGYQSQVKLKENYKHLHELIHPADIEKDKMDFERYLNQKSDLYENDYRIILPDGSIRWVHATAKGKWDGNGKLIRMAGSHQDITELKAIQEKLEYLAYHDPLTQLPNRVMLQKNWCEWYQSDQNGKSAILFIDSDNYKLINDTLGHSFGDQLISAIGSRLQTEVSANQRVFRISGDEFVICGSGYNSPQEIENDAKQILQIFEDPFDLSGNKIHLSVSMGISIYPDHGTNIEELLKNADIAMYKAKELGKNRFVFYNLLMQDSIQEYVKLEQELRNAFNQQEFSIYYQPQVSLVTGKVTGFEALLRWFSPTLGEISPLKFIKIAEESGLIVKLGEWAFRHVGEFLKNIHQTYPDMNISVNVSILQLMQDDFVETVLNILDEYQLNPKCLELEITESMLIESFDSIHEKLKRLKYHHIRIALDDFGKGYSSLNYLRQLPISTLKIDKCFVDQIIDNPQQQIITGDIVSLGQKMGLTVIAEGVEHPEQLDYLRKYHCDKIQGNIFSRPLPEQDVFKYLEGIITCNLVTIT